MARTTKTTTIDGIEMTPEMIDRLLEKVADRMWATTKPILARRQREKAAQEAAEAERMASLPSNVISLDAYRKRRELSPAV